MLGYYRKVFDAVDDKQDAGYQRSITDFWGRMLSYQLINATDGGPGYTFSSIADDPQFIDGKVPLPFLVADGRGPGEKVVALNSTVYEFNPWELGSADPTLDGYVPLKYVGSNFTAGKIPDDQDCVAGFDNAGYVMGTSSTLFNQLVLYLEDPNSGYVPDGVPDFVIDALKSILSVLDSDNNDIADWTPNPFKGWNPEDNHNTNSSRLTLVDGGEDLQNIPYHPHILSDRHVDVVFSIDSSADTESTWPNGASAVATYERSLESISQGSSFPAIPGQDTFLNLGLNTRPTFFGCDATNTSSVSPLIVYIPNYPYLFSSNISTFTLSLNASERDALVQNGWAVATQLNSTRDDQWSVCVGCAMLQRSFGRTKTEVPQACKQCFDRYCWNGTVDDSTPAPYFPSLYSEPLDIQSAATSLLQGGSGVVSTLLVVTMGMAMLVLT